MSSAAELLPFLTEAERSELMALVDVDVAQVLWRPLPGPQSLAAASEADVVGYGGAAGCVDGATEFLTPWGWKRIDSYAKGDKVGQWAPDGALTFAAPKRYINEPTADGTLISFRASRVNMVLSPEHRVPALDWAKRFTVRRAGRLELKPSRHHIPTHCRAPSWEGLPYTEAELRLMVAVHADGSFGSRTSTRHCRVSLRKGRKKGRLEALLRALGLPWREYHNPKRPTEVRYSFYAPTRSKDYGDWWGLSQEQAAIVFEEMVHWDGSECARGDLSFSSTNRGDADFIQYVAHCCGRYASIHEYAADGPRAACYKVTISRKPEHFVKFADHIRIERVQAERQYCFETGTGFWLARREGRIFATGNSGKTDLAIGLALTQHLRTQIFRREGPQLVGIIDRLKELVPPELVRGNPPYYDDGIRKIELNSMPNPGDELKYQGRPKDLLVLDEAVNFLESQARFVMGWVRSTVPGQRKRVLMTFNPPTTPEGRWIVSFFGPWLDEDNPLYPTEPGTLRWVYVDPGTGKDVWLPGDDGRPFALVDGIPCYDFDVADFRPEDVIVPESRTFIPGRISDNPYLLNTGYLRTLQAMPEPLRSQMLYGDFNAGLGEDPWQVCPTGWVEAAMARWEERSPKGEQMSLGVDVARGGQDDTVIVGRYDGLWFDRPMIFPGAETPDGQATAGLVLGARRDGAPIHIDVIGVGASPFDVLRSALEGTRHTVVGVNSAAKATLPDRSGALRFRNMRSQLWWLFREALDPAADTGIALPPDQRLKRELCAPHWSMSGSTLQVESREDIIARIGYSPDVATAFIMALLDTPKIHVLEAASAQQDVMDYDPFANM